MRRIRSTTEVEVNAGTRNLPGRKLDDLSALVDFYAQSFPYRAQARAELVRCPQSGKRLAPVLVFGETATNARSARRREHSMVPEQALLFQQN